METGMGMGVGQRLRCLQTHLLEIHDFDPLCFVVLNREEGGEGGSECSG